MVERHRHGPDAKASARPRWRRALKIGAGALVGLSAIAFAAPYVAIAYATKRATACLAAYEAPRSAAPPSCEPTIRWLVTPSRVPWTRDAASYKGEELGARIAFYDYRDAVIGEPNRARMSETAAELERAERVVQEGSRRIALDDLGPAMGAPNLARTADALGDRAALLERWDRWLDWHVRLHILHAALLEGDEARAVTIAQRYAEWNVLEEDLRATTGALLCMGGSAARGIELLTTLQNDRAARRYAAMARNWGDVRGLLVACAAKAGVLPPPKPESPDAGQGVPIAPRALLRLRLASDNTTDPAEAREREAALAGAMSLLRENAGASEDTDDASVGVELRTPGTRAAILAAILASGRDLTAAQVIELGRPWLAGGEAPLLPSRAITALDWMLDARGVGPVIAAKALERAAERARVIGDQARAAAPSEAKALDAIAGALFIEAAKAYAKARDEAAAIHAIERGGELALESKPATALARSSARYVTGNIEEALAELDAAPELAVIAPPSGVDASLRLIRAAALIQRAELLAALRSKRDQKLDGATAKAAAEAAIAADLEAALAGDPAQSARARWTRLALAKHAGAPPLRPETEVDVRPRLSAALASRSPLAIDGSADRPPSHKGAGPDRPFPWVGLIPDAPPTSGAPLPREPALSASLSLWSAIRSAPADERRALRYMLMKSRADVAASPLAELELATEVLGDSGDVEIWLDALTAIDARVMSHRSYTWLRALAASWRGDAAAASRWTQSYKALCVIASDPTRAELARFLGI